MRDVSGRLGIGVAGTSTRKLSVNDRAAAVAAGFERGLLPLGGDAVFNGLGTGPARCPEPGHAPSPFGSMIVPDVPAQEKSLVLQHVG